MKLRGMIFDFDGTLADTLSMCVDAFQVTFQQILNKHLTPAEIVALFGVTEEGMIRQVAPDRWQEGLQIYLTEYERIHDRCTEPFPGITAMLQLLKDRGVALAVVTGKGPASADISMRYLDLLRYFDVVEAGSPDAPIKPQAIRKVLARWGIAPHEAAYVGDVPYDMEASREAGLFAIGAAWAESATVQGSPAASIVFNSISDFEVWIDKEVEAS